MKLESKISIINALNKIKYEMIQNGEFEGAILLLESLKIDSLVNYLLNGVKDNKYTEEDISMLDAIINILQAIYNNSGLNSPISDENYDKIYELHLRLTGNDIVGAQLENNATNKTYHKYPKLRGTLDKKHFITENERGNDNRKSIEGWIKQLENRLGRQLRPSECEIELFPKWDGNSIIFECDSAGNVERALTRGYTVTNQAQDVTCMFKGCNFSSVDSSNTRPFGVQTEVVISQSAFNELNQSNEFKNKRNIVAGILNPADADPKMLKYLTIIPLRFQYLNEEDVHIPGIDYEYYPFKVSNLFNFKDIKKCIKEIRDEIEERFEIDIDGIVIRLTNKDLQKALGREGAINKFEAAYKFPPEEAKSIIKNVEFSIGIHGNVTPVAKFEPVIMHGNTVKSSNLGSIERFKSLNLHVGDEVKIKYDIIPYLYKDSSCKENTDNPKIEVPTNCPYCGHLLVESPKLKCVNVACSCRKIGKILNWIEKLNIKNISEGIITTLFNNGFLTEIDDLYRLKYRKTHIANLDGFGAKSTKIILDAIESILEIYDYELVGSLGIPSISRKTARKILDVYTLEDIFKMLDKDPNKLYKHLVAISSIGNITAASLVTGLEQNRELIERLKSYLSIKRDSREYTLKVCFSKIRDKEFEQFLIDHSTMICDNFNKNINILIVPNKHETSSKIDKANNLGIPIMTLEEAKEHLGYNK